MRKKWLFLGLLPVVILLISAYNPLKRTCTKKESSVPIPESGIHFTDANWQNALAQARKENKLVFLDAFASWCGPCQQLKRKTFPDEQVGAFFNSNFINIALDMEKGEGPGIAEKYGITAYPTLIIADAEGNVLSTTKGYHTPEQLLSFGKNVIDKRKKN